MPRIRSISMWLGHHDAHLRRMIHCPLCGNPLIQVNGDIKQIVMGDVQEELKERGVTIRCRKRLRDEMGNNYSCNTETNILDA